MESEGRNKPIVFDLEPSDVSTSWLPLVSSTGKGRIWWYKVKHMRLAMDMVMDGVSHVIGKHVALAETVSVAGRNEN
jgi:hypothetical protein